MAKEIKLSQESLDNYKEELEYLKRPARTKLPSS